MASSKKTLDLDSLTFQTMYIKSQSTLQLNAYTIPVIPGDGTVIKRLQYLTPDQMLSAGKLYLTQSTIPEIISTIDALSSLQLSIFNSISTVSTSVGRNVSSLQAANNNFRDVVYQNTYGPTYSNILESTNTIRIQNIATFNFQGLVRSLGAAISSISSSFSPNFSSLGLVLESTFNQGPSVSTLSTYINQYFNGLAESIPVFRNDINRSISTSVASSICTIADINKNLITIINTANGASVSTLSTVIVSSISSYFNTLISLNIGPGMSSLSTGVRIRINELSTQYSLNSGIPGICSLSTVVGITNSTNLTSLQSITGTPGLCTLSTVVTSTLYNIGQNVLLYGSGNTVCTFSTILQTQINSIQLLTNNIGYPYIIIQQELVKISISTLSTSFSYNYNNIASLSSFSSMLPNVYSTLSTNFGSVAPVSTVLFISTVEGSNVSTLKQYMQSTYTQIYTGPGLSSLSTSIGPNFSSLSTSLQSVLTSFSSAINNISSIRADPGICTLSTFFFTSTNLYASSYTRLFTSTTLISASNSTLTGLLIALSNYDNGIYQSLNPAANVAVVQNDVNTFISYINTNIPNLITGIITISSYISSQFSLLVYSYNSTTTKAVSTTLQLISSYTAVSSIVEQNLFSPNFSTFTANIITTSNFTASGSIYVSSLGINQSTTREVTLAMIGSASLDSSPPPTINHIMVGRSNTNLSTIFTSSNAQSNYTTNSLGQFINQANDIAYNGSLWVTVGTDSLESKFIRYTSDPTGSWSNATFPNAGGTLSGINCVKWNGSYWLAGGSADITVDANLLESPNGIIWSAVPNSKFLDSVLDISWNGYSWVAVGSSDSGNNIIYTNPINGLWNQASNVFSIQANSITNNGRVWVAVGTGTTTIKYSYNPFYWQNVVGPQISTPSKVVWNGDKFLVGGTNSNSSNIMYSYNGVNWTYVSVPVSSITSILWNGNLWKAAGLSNLTDTTATHLISYDAINWSTVNVGPTTGIIYGQAYASNTTPNLQLSNFDIYSGDIPVIMNSRKRMNIIQSTIYFNDGDLTIRKVTSSITIANIGINTTYPEYALDIAVGNARKPVGSTWITASDARVKSDIMSADLISCAKLVSDIPLRTYSFTGEFQAKTGVSSDIQYGFIAQEVKQVLPNAVRYTNEFGLADFHSLDTDQIFKLEFGATQYLLRRIEEMEEQISTLERRI